MGLVLYENGAIHPQSHPRSNGTLELRVASTKGMVLYENGVRARVRLRVTDSRVRIRGMASNPCRYHWGAFHTRLRLRHVSQESSQDEQNPKLRP